MIIRLCPPKYTYSLIHFKKTDITKKNVGFMRFPLPVAEGVICHDDTTESQKKDLF